jgi:hypothetical protein
LLPPGGLENQLTLGQMAFCPPERPDGPGVKPLPITIVDCDSLPTRGSGSGTIAVSKITVKELRPLHQPHEAALSHLNHHALEVAPG